MDFSYISPNTSPKDLAETLSYYFVDGKADLYILQITILRNTLYKAKENMSKSKAISILCKFVSIDVYASLSS